MSDNYNKGRIIKNSAFLYLRMLFTMWFNLWATRLVLGNLGVDNMGVYGVVGSIVGLFSVLTGGVTSAVQRYITFELGRGEGKPNEVFCTSLNIIIALSVAIVIILEVLGLWFLNTSVKIPLESQDAAFWVFQLSVFTTIVNLISIPYNALIIAHEKMGAFAWISILQVLLNWASAYCISLWPANKRLVMYAILLALASLIVRLIYQIYCHFKFEESKYHFSINKSLIKEMGKFTGVSTTSNILQTVAGQGLVFVINWTFGVGINAVYQIALQLKNSVLSFGMNIFKAISPQITKTYADGEMDIHKKLVYSGSKIEVYFIYVIMIPFLLKTDYILHLWLGKVPLYTVEFCQSTILLSLTYAAFEPIRTAVMATNNISRFMIVPDTFFLVVSLPLSFLIAKYTGNPAYMILTSVVLDIITCLIRIYLASKVSFIRVREFLKVVIIPCIIVLFISMTIGYFYTKMFSDTIINLIIILMIHLIILTTAIFVFGINKFERSSINGMVRQIAKHK